MINLHKKLNWRLHNLKVHQEKIAEKVKEVEQIIEMRAGNEKSLRKIGEKLGMSHQKVDNIIKLWNI